MTGVVGIWVIKKFNLKDTAGKEIMIEPKPTHKGNLLGGIIFGFGWAITGACPGPIYALIGMGHLFMIIPLLSAILGAFVYSVLRDKLPH